MMNRIPKIMWLAIVFLIFCGVHTLIRTVSFAFYPTGAEQAISFKSMLSKGELNAAIVNSENDSTKNQVLLNSSRASVQIVSSLKHTEHNKFVVPSSISKLLHPRVLHRLQSAVVNSNCLFAAINSKQQRAAGQWKAKRYAVYQCSGGCGGFGDRMKGIFSVLFHAIAIGYEFRIDWNTPVSLHPEILVPSRWLNWTDAQTDWSEKGHGLRFMDTGSKPYRLCEWRSLHLVKIKTNGHPIPQGHHDCDFFTPTINDILMNQSLTQSCIRTATNRWTGGTQCMGCIWWYLFQIGKSLQKHLSFELNRLRSWRNRRHLDNAFAIGLHVRAGDSNMKAGRGREKTVDALVKQMELCASNFSKGIVSKYFAVVVSDSVHAKRLMERWPWLQVYAVRTKPFHIDKNKGNSKGETMSAVLSVVVDLFVLSFQDALLLSGTSGYGYLAQGVGMFNGSNVVQCFP